MGSAFLFCLINTLKSVDNIRNKAYNIDKIKKADTKTEAHGNDKTKIILWNR